MERSRDLWREYRVPFLWTLAAGVAVSAGVAMAGDLGRLLREPVLDWRYVPLLLTLAPMNYVLRFVKWSYFLRLLGARVGLGANLLVFLAGLGMTLTPGKAGEFLKCYLLYEVARVPSRTSSAAVMAERYTDGISMLLLTLLGSVSLGLRADVVIALVFFCIVLLAFIICLHQGRLRQGILSWLGRIPRLGQRVQEAGHGFSDAARTILAPKPLAFSVGLGVVSWGLEGFVLYLALLALGTEIPALESIFVVSFSAIAGALSLLPGGLGVAEGTVFGLLLWRGFARPVASAATLITRFSTLWLGVAVGVVGLLLTGRLLSRHGTGGGEAPHVLEE